MLFLGSFPPPKARWSMDFFYPNWINDFWRIQGLIHYADASHFEMDGKRFDRERIIDFCTSKGLAFYDTASKVCRLKGNASDEFLVIIEPSDIGGMLSRMPECHTIVTTGGKSSEELAGILSAPAIPKVGTFIDLQDIRWWRMPSTSRAYPMSLKAKTAHYSKLF
ncbi:MAG: uracil-DNA glycosylase family protein [Bacteroidaceae bacterium]|nr:uracil-DNA glycosylase family protein [Bacteroidaceae bacterium]